MSGHLPGQAVEWKTADGGNGHFYESVFASGGIGWEEAKTAAEVRGGYLATITSSAENTFVRSTAEPSLWDGLAGPWIGGFQPPGTTPPSAGWQWVTTEPWSYNNWNAGEPNDWQGAEERCLRFCGGGDRWCDSPAEDLVIGFIVEYETAPPVRLPTPQQWTQADGGNGHFYQVVVEDVSLRWDDARIAATRRGGYLATATSDAENRFIHGLALNVSGAWEGAPGASWLVGPWLGGFQPPDTTPANAGWEWVTAEPWSFTAWSSSEPNDSGGEERFLCYWHPGGNRAEAYRWNDASGTVSAYIVEYESQGSIFVPEFLAGDAELVWFGPEGSEIEVLVSGGQVNLELGSVDDSIVRWDTTLVPDGVYRLDATIRDPVSGELFAELSFSTAVLNGVTWHNEPVTTAETWAGSETHVVGPNFEIAAGGAVTLEPGAVVKMLRRSSFPVRSGGLLTAQGTGASPIILTSIYDDAAGGDTNFDGDATLPRPGDWAGLAVADAGGSAFNSFVELRYTSQRVSGTIAADTVWHNSSLVDVAGVVTVASGVTLRIQPGTVVKMGDKAELRLDPGATLEAPGTAAEPIVFTSFADDSHAGDSNEDGDSTSPAAGDWRWIYINSATADLAHVSLLFGGGTSSGTWTETGVVRTTGNAAVTMRSCEIHDAFFDGVLAWGGTVEIENSIFTGMDRGLSAHPGGTVTVRNSVFHDNRLGLLNHGGTLHMFNSIVSGSLEAGVDWDFGALDFSSDHSIFWNPDAAEGDFRRLDPVVGSNGNQAVDPKFIDVARGNYRLDYGSPAIDAANSPEAPETDLLGAPRIDVLDVPNSGIPDAESRWADIGAFEFSETAPSPLDLVVTAVQGPAEAQVGDSVVIHWTVRNDGSAAAIGPWFDRVSLVQGAGTPAEQVHFAGEVLNATVLGPGESATFSAEVTVPGAQLGAHRWRVETNARSTVFEGSNRLNNSTDAAAPVNISLPILVSGGAPFSRQFLSAGDRFWFLLDAADEDMLVRVTADGDDGAATGIYLGFGRLPSPQDYDARQEPFGDDDVSAFARRQGAPVYVLVTADSLSAPGVALTVVAEPIQFSLASVEPASVGDRGTATLALTGAALGEDLAFELVSPTGDITPASAVFSTSPLVAFATFPLDGLSHGDHRVRVRRGAATVEAPRTVEVTETVPPRLQVEIHSDGKVRAGRTGSFSYSYRNAGNIDLVAPIMKIIATVPVEEPLPIQNLDVYGVARAQVDPIPDDKIGHIEHVLGISGSGPAGVLRPGGRGGSYASSFQVPLDQPDLELQLHWTTEAQEGGSFPWFGLESPMKPPGATEQGWNKVFGNLMTLAGSTHGEVNSFVADTATEVSRLGEREHNFFRLLGLSSDLADPFGSLQSMGEERNTGRLVSDPTTNKVLQTTAGWDQRTVLVVHFLGTRRFYEETDDPNRFVPSVDDGSELIKTGPSYTLNEYDGGWITFNGGGTQLESFSDGLATTISASYEGGKLARLEQDGQTVLAFEYDNNGYLAKQSHFDGTEIIYEHNASGELTEWKHSIGPPIRFEYHAGGPAAGLLRSMEDESGVAEFFYDELGRLQKITSGGSETIFSFPAFGRKQVEVDGQLFEERRDKNYNIVSVKGPEGNGVTILDRGSQTVYGSSSGSSIVHEYDNAGFLTRLVNANGRSRSVKIDPLHESFASVTNEHGGTISMSYNPQGEVADIVYPDGTTSRQTFDARGNGDAWTNRQGQTLRFEYIPGTDRVRARVYPDGARDEFTYDQAGRILTATNATGTTAFEYDAVGAITRVTYPHGHSLSYEYDHLGRRISMTDDSGFVTRYRYNQRGQLDAVLNEASQAWTEYAFDSAGRIVQRANGNGTVSTYGYDPTGALASVTHRDSGDQMINHATYSASSPGSRSSKVTIDGETNYEYDDLHQLISQTGAEGDHVFTYDLAGNRTRAVSDGDRTDYRANSLDRYVQAGEAALSYNLDGDLIASRSQAEEWEYDYDVDGKLTGYRGGGLNVVYQYDALGYRVGEVVNGVEKHYLLDPVGDLETVAAVTPSGRSQFVFSHHGLIAQVNAGGDYYYHEDGSFNITEITDASQQVISSYRYGPFGRIRERTEGVGNSFTFGGSLGNMETANQQYWIFTRQYDPVLGRFHILDPARMPGANGYLYCSNDPINRIDINGNDGVLSSYIPDNYRNIGMTSITTGGGLFDAGMTRIQQGVNNLEHTLQVDSAQRHTARSRTEYNRAKTEYSRKVRKHGPRLSKKKAAGLGQRRTAAKEKFHKSRRNLRKLEREGPVKATGSGAAKKLSYLGTANAAYNLNQTYWNYRDGKTPAYELVHEIGVFGGDVVQYAPGLGQAASIVAAVADPVSQAAFGWWFTPTKRANEEIFGPRGLELLDGRANALSDVVGSFDPNDKSSTGFGELGHITGDNAIIYTIRFENVATASAAAQEVVVTDTLDPNLDWSTFELVGFGFNDVEVQPTFGQRSYEGTLTTAADPNPVRATLDLDPLTGELRFVLQSFDPFTLDFPSNPLAGFLPPNDGTGRGEGYLRFSILPRAGLADGTRIENRARIVFDLNAPIDTNVAVNTIDRTAPSSAVAAFAAAVPPEFEVSLTGDDGGGAGIAFYDVYVSVDGGPFTLHASTDADTLSFSGTAGLRYGFYSVATDNLGFVEGPKSVADAEVEPVDAYLAWAIGEFGEAIVNTPGLEESVWGRLADPDRDELPNAIEQQMVLDPNVFDTADAYATTVEEDQFVFSYRRANTRVAVAGLAPEWSTNGVDWSAEGFTVRILENRDDHHMVEARLPIGEAPARLVRLRLRLE